MKKMKYLLPAAILMVSVLCIAVIAWFVIAGRRDAAKLAAATDAFGKGDYKTALPLLSQIATKNPADAEVCHMMAVIFESERNYAAALNSYRQAKRLDPKNPEFKTKYVEMLSAVGDYQTLLYNCQHEFDRKELSRDNLFYYLEALIADNKTNAAESAMKSWDPADARLAYLQGFLALKRNNPARALELFSLIPDDALPLPVRHRLLPLIGALRLTAGDNVKAETAFRQLADEAPEIGDYLLAQFYRQTGRDLEYRAQLAKTVQANPAHLAARVELAERYAGEKNTEGLKKLIRKPANRAEVEVFSYIGAMSALFEERFSDAEKSLTIASSCSDRPFFHVLRIQCRIALRDIDKLPESVNALLRLMPAEEARTRIVSELYPLLADAVHRNAFEEADQCAELILSVSDHPSPARTTALEVRLQTAISSGNDTGITGNASELLRANPQHPVANLAMGNAMLARQRPEAALASFKRLPPDNPAALFGQARAFVMLNQSEEADAKFAAAWKLSPDNLPLFENYAAFLLGRKRGAEIAALATALPATPEGEYLAAFLQAKYAESEKKPDDAQKYYLAALVALEKFPESPAVDYQRAFLFALTGQDVKAEVLYDKLLEANPVSLQILLNLSEVKAALGKKQEAMSLARSAERIAPNSEAVKQCLSRRE